MYIRVSVGLRNTKECSMSYRQSEMYKLTTYLKDLPQQSVSSKKNLQVVDKFPRQKPKFWALGVTLM